MRYLTVVLAIVSVFIFISPQALAENREVRNDPRAIIDPVYDEQGIIDPVYDELDQDKIIDPVYRTSHPDSSSR